MILGAIGIFFVLAILYLNFEKERKKVKGIPQVKGGLPVFGHVLTLLKGSAWDKFASWVPKYGRIFSVNIFTREIVCIADPAVLKVILQTKLNSFLKDREWTYKPFLVLLGNGLVTSHGKSWLRQRTVLANHFKRDILLDIPLAAIQAAQRFIQRLKTAVTNRKDDKYPEMGEEFRHLALQVIARLVLSLSPQESDETFAKMYLPIVEEGNMRVWQPWREYLLTPSFFKFQRDVKKLDDYVTQLMEKRRNLRSEEKTKTVAGDSMRPRRVQDILDKMLDSLELTDASVTLEWNNETIKQFRDEIKTFILAGHETSASMLTWTILELSLPENANFKERVLAEAKSAFPNYRELIEQMNNPNLSADQLQSLMPSKDKLDSLLLCEACLRESLRKYSVVPTVVRVAAEEVIITDYHQSTNNATGAQTPIVIPKGATLMVSMQGVHHNPEIWTEPLKYNPDRFFIDQTHLNVPFSFLPFIEGPRMCLGQYLALLESKIVLALILLHFDFEILEKEKAKEKHDFMIPIIPKHGHYFKPVPKF
jgi:cytochrome P450